MFANDASNFESGPRLLAKSPNLNEQAPASSPIDKGSTSHEPSHFFKSLQWSADGTSILASLSTNTLATYLPPPDLLSPPPDRPHALGPYSLHRLPEPAHATAVLPSYDLSSPSTCLALAAVRNLPLRLFSMLYTPSDDDEDARGASAVLASYPLVSPTTEAYLGMHSLEFGSENWIYAGTEGGIAAFDLNRSGEAPASMMRTGRGRGRRRRGRALSTSMGFEDVDGIKGIVSALSLSSERMLAAGTFRRGIGLYSGFGDDCAVATFSLQGTEDGGGVTELRWSSCGRYLFVVERASDGIGVWDIRGLGKRLAWLRGRRAKTQQRLGVSVFNEELWAGGTDGKVRVWDQLGQQEGDVDPHLVWDAHGDAVSSVEIHPSGSVVATSSGQRHFPSFDEPASEVLVDAGDARSSREPISCDSTLKAWSL